MSFADTIFKQQQENLRKIVGYLNFSSGPDDPQFYRAFSDLTEAVRNLADRNWPLPLDGKTVQDAQPPLWRMVRDVLIDSLKPLAENVPVFHDLSQAEAVVGLVFDELLPQYRKFHEDVLAHHADDFLFQPFFIARACQRVLQAGPPWNESERITTTAIKRLNDYLGYRPIAVLEDGRQMQPYEHEWVGVIPLYIAGAGVGAGPYQQLVSTALEILAQTSEEVLQLAWFYPDKLSEIALDPRAFDFDHPVHRRPNHQYGGWDTASVDNDGYYRRYIIREITIDGLLHYVENTEGDRSELLFEAAAVLVGTMLMGAGTTGYGPACPVVELGLQKLLARIVEYRDKFYEELLAKLTGRHKERLAQEAQQLQQPFGRVRQYCNFRVVKQRAEQVQRRHFALLLARLGRPDEARQQLSHIQVPSARFHVEVRCCLHSAEKHLEQGRLEEAEQEIARAEQLVKRGIECGAFVDPWNILGFAGQFSLFPSPEASVPDHRIEELIEILRDIFDLYAKVEKEAAARGDTRLLDRLDLRCSALAEWWDQFASTAVSDIPGFSGGQYCESARKIADAIAAWTKAGTAAGDLPFWSRQVEKFDSPKCFALAVETLLEHQDLTAAMSLMAVWLNSAQRIGLGHGDHAFSRLVINWLQQLWETQAQSFTAEQQWKLTQRFFGLLEANAEDYWEAPKFELVQGAAREATPDTLQEEDENDEEDRYLFRSAYEGVIYKDSTADGVESNLLDELSQATDWEFGQEATRLIERFTFLVAIAWGWQYAAVWLLGKQLDEEQKEVLHSWYRDTQRKLEGLEELARAISRYRIAPPRPTLESMLEYDRQRNTKDLLLMHLAQVHAALRWTQVCLSLLLDDVSLSDDWLQAACGVITALQRDDENQLERFWPKFLLGVASHPVLSRPIFVSGNVVEVSEAELRGQLFSVVLQGLARCGRIRDLTAVLQMLVEGEQHNPLGSRAITEFDRLFSIAVRAAVGTLVRTWKNSSSGSGRSSRPDLVEACNLLLYHLMPIWAQHLRNTRVSVLDTVREPQNWQDVVAFIQRYGDELFTQHFMAFGNLRALMAQGGERTLSAMLELEDDPNAPHRLLEDIRRGAITQRRAGELLELIAESVLEFYPFYVDYNTSTVQSDRGSNLYRFLTFLHLLVGQEHLLQKATPPYEVYRSLIEADCEAEAQQWFEMVARESAPHAEELLRAYETLRREFGIHLESVYDALKGGLLRPMEVLRLRTLLRKTLSAKPPESDNYFSQFYTGALKLIEEAPGAGIELPKWLQELYNELERSESPFLAQSVAEHLVSRFPEKNFSKKKLLAQLRNN